MIDELAGALQRPKPPQGEPLIVENQIAQTKSMHVVVIWDAWKDMSPTERSKVILDAFAKARRARDTTITVAMGLTNEEALRMSFLPYSIVTTRRQRDDVSLDELAKAMSGVGGIIVKVGTSVELRFATLEQAEDAYRLLSQKVPGPYWAIVQEQPAAE
ncbi:MAG TPA: hypothetical protein VMD30_08670 [Tepidisphaeraceae bacterium]|nr:hypothetical protein [Tepidisphaeraceae bacterium]